MDYTGIAWGRVYTTPEEFENAALFLRLGLPSTLIRHENRAFRKLSLNRRNLKTPAFHFNVGRKTFWKRSSSKRWRHDIKSCDSLREFFSNTNPKWSVIVAFLNSSGVVWTENIWCVFRVKPPFSNSSGVVTDYITDEVLRRPFWGFEIDDFGFLG